MCNYSTGLNFYLIATQFGIQVDLVKIQAMFEDDKLCGAHQIAKDLNNFSTTSPILILGSL